MGAAGNAVRVQCVEPKAGGRNLPHCLLVSSFIIYMHIVRNCFHGLKAVHILHHM